MLLTGTRRGLDGKTSSLQKRKLSFPFFEFGGSSPRSVTEAGGGLLSWSAWCLLFLLRRSCLRPRGRVKRGSTTWIALKLIVNDSQ